MNDSIEKGNNSRKEEILAKSRESKKDEGHEHAEFAGFSLGERTGSVIGMAIGLFSFITGQYTVFLAVFSIVFAAAFGQSIPVYRFTKRKYYLAWVIISAIFAVVSFVVFIAISLGWIEPSVLGRWWGR